jgi:hypothetical protein
MTSIIAHEDCDYSPEAEQAEVNYLDQGLTIGAWLVEHLDVFVD